MAIISEASPIISELLCHCFIAYRLTIGVLESLMSIYVLDFPRTEVDCRNKHLIFYDKKGHGENRKGKK